MLRYDPKSDDPKLTELFWHAPYQLIPRLVIFQSLMSSKKCFVIAPIGSPESKTRVRSDLVFDFVITPVTKECGYETLRADSLDEPGIITNQVIQRLLNSVDRS
jgi:hypothetical protein